MKFSELQLPSNKNFGFFFSAVFFTVAVYSIYVQNQIIAYPLFVVALLFFISTLLKPELLLPLNKLWMQFGLLLGMIINPIVMAFIFFGLITPFSIIMRMMGRDELRLKKTIESHWTPRSQNLPPTDFTKQF
jgi:hypothetical protein